MSSQLTVGGVQVAVQHKAIKNVHLSVYPPDGQVRMAVPDGVDATVIRAFVIAKLGWIRRQQAKIKAQPRETPREFMNRESHYVWGRRYLLKVIEAPEAPSVVLKPRQLVLRVRPDTDAERRGEVFAAWYRAQLRSASQPLIDKWQKRLGVSVSAVHVQTMRTRWGSCNTKARSIRLNTELAKKPVECLEYIIVHEMVHLIEPNHSQRFLQLMDRYMPAWRQRKDLLNSLPTRGEAWRY